jgi:hypothetical protein
MTGACTKHIRPIWRAARERLFRMQSQRLFLRITGRGWMLLGFSVSPAYLCLM